jgi:saccharopine dehydrogenase-like NADP-dependent oxidoreductase
MKVLAIGGSGGMGRYAVAAMQDFDTVERIVVADLNVESAGRFVAQLNDKVSAIGLDVSDTIAMREAMADADLVVNTAGPFYRFGVPILQAAIDENCHYIDICDDWAPTLEMLKLDASAKQPVYAPLSGWVRVPAYRICWH